jgi:3-phosphoshikimate 1-carboxyvinyltransferase
VAALGGGPPAGGLRVGGIVRVPGDKSISHRALLLAALAPAGASRVTGVLDSADVRSTAGALRALGAAVPDVGPDLTVAGAPLRAPAADLDCGNSGTSARLLAGVAAAQPFASRFTGDASLSRRPMRRVAGPLTAMGAEVTFDGEDGRLPMRVRGGALRATEWTSEAASAQVKSAVLLAGVLAGVEVTVREPHPSRDHTERMLAARGVDVYVHRTAVHLPGGQRLAPATYGARRPVVCRVLRRARGARRRRPRRAPRRGAQRHPHRLLLRPGPDGRRPHRRRRAARGRRGRGHRARRTARRLRGTEVDAAEVPSMVDELPLLACVAALAEGDTVVRGAAELRVKESDRIAAVVAGLRAVGADATSSPTGSSSTAAARARSPGAS